MADIIARYPSDEDVDVDDYYAYFGRIVQVTSQLFLPDNWFNKSVKKDKAYKAAQLIFSWQGRVFREKYINYEEEDHGLFLADENVMMPIFLYEVVTDEDGNRTVGGDKCSENSIDFEERRENDSKYMVAQVKPYLLGWMQPLDNIRLITFAEDVGVGVNIITIR